MPFLANLGNIIGINPHIVGVIIIILAAMAASFFVYFYFGNRIIAVLVVIPFLIFGGIMDWLPLWICATFGVVGLSSIYMFRFAEETQLVEDTDNLDEWGQFGGKLKEAYMAKFGYENTGFNDEVDKRIVVMQQLRRGFTHTIARDWLKRMKRFTEMK